MATLDQVLRAMANLLVEKQVLAEQVGDLTRHNTDLQRRNKFLTVELHNMRAAKEAAQAEAADLKTSILDKLAPSNN